MNVTIYNYLSYRKYIKKILEANGVRSGLKRKASEALNVYSTFISQVILGKANLSLEQAEKMNLFLNHSEEEGEYFLDLLIYERAGNYELKKRFKKRIEQKRTKRMHIKSRLEKSSELDERDQEKFYSSHLYGLLHVLVSIPRYQTRKEITNATGFPTQKVNEAIDFLITTKILKEDNGKLSASQQHVHLSRESKLINQHHTNWRSATINRIGFSTPTDLHYSLAFSCSKKDAYTIREKLLKNLEDLAKTVEKSKEEELFIYCFDFYNWT